MADRWGMTGLQARALENHQSNVRSVADSFKRAVERDHKPARPQLRNEAYRGMWKFAPIRQEIKDEIDSLANIFREGSALPSDFSLRIAKLSIALYMLEKMQEMVEAVRQNQNTTLVSLFDTARASVEKMLGSGFFKKTRDEMIHSYLDAEPAFAACAKCCSVVLLAPDEAVKAYKMKVADMIEEESK